MHFCYTIGKFGRFCLRFSRTRSAFLTNHYTNIWFDKRLGKTTDR